MPKKRYNNFIILLAVEILLAVIILAGCFRKEQLIGSFSGENMQKAEGTSQKSEEYESSRMELKPGVYQVRIKTDFTDRGEIRVNMRCNQAFFKAMRCNGVTVEPEQGSGMFYVYVTSRVSEAYVYCEFSGTDSEALTELQVWRTSLGNRILFLLALSAFALLDFMILFRRRILEGKVSRRQQVVFWTMAAGIFLAYTPWLTDYFTLGEESTFHLSRIAYLKDALQQGAALPVRLQGSWLCGHGYGVSFFEGDLFLYIPALLMLAGFSVMTVVKIFVFMILTATALISYHFLKKCTQDEYSALYGSMFYLLSPICLYNVYNKGAMGEYTAMAFLPLVCCGMYLLITEDTVSEKYRRYKWYLIWGMSAVLLSHVALAKTAAVLAAAACIVFWKKAFRKGTLVQLAEAAGVILVINAWFWMPSVFMAGRDSYYFNGGGQAPSVLGGSFQWMIPAGVLVSAAAAFFFRKAVTDQAGAVRAAAGIGAAALILSASYQLNNFALDTAPVFLYNAENMDTDGIMEGDYLLQDTWQGGVYYHGPLAEEGLSWRNYQKQGTDVTITLENTADQTRYVEIPLFGYPGYRIRQLTPEAGEFPVIAGFRGEHGDIVIEVPAGYQGTVKIFYGGFALFRWAELVSAAGFGVIGFLYLFRKLRRTANESGEMRVTVCGRAGNNDK